MPCFYCHVDVDNDAALYLLLVVVDWLTGWLLLPGIEKPIQSDTKIQLLQRGVHLFSKSHTARSFVHVLFDSSSFSAGRARLKCSPDLDGTIIGIPRIPMTLSSLSFWGPSRMRCCCCCRMELCCCCEQEEYKQIQYGDDDVN